MRVKYQAKDRQGRPRAGETVAESLAEARQKLRAEGLFVLAVDRLDDESTSRAAWSLRRRVAKSELLLLLSQLTIMCQSGVDLAESLQNLSEQGNRPQLKEIVKRVHNDVSNGMAFSAALKRNPHVFDEAFVAAVAAGELSGTLTSVLERLTALIRGEIRLRNTVWTMLTYPIVLCGVTALVLAAMIFFVLPQFNKVFVDLGRSPPPLTQFLLGVGEFAQGNALWLLILAIGAGGAAVYARRQPLARRLWDHWLLHGAVVRGASRSLAAGRVFRLLGAMLQTGVPLVDAVRLCGQASGNGHFRRLFDRIEREVLNGQGMAKSLFAASFLPEGAAHMAATAERSGRLGQVLQTVGEYYEDDGERRLRDLIKILEPAIILSLGAVVALVVLAVVLPLLDVSTMSH